MTRDEALRRLEGTWSFEVRRGRVTIREISLLSAVAAIRRERPPGGPVRVAARPPQGTAVSGD